MNSDGVGQALAKKGPKEKITCPRCKQQVTKGCITGHQKRPGCKAAHLARQLRGEGFGECGDEFTKHVCQDAGVPLRREPTDYSKPAWGRTRNGSENGLKTRTWLPQWIVTLLSRSWVLTQGFGTEEARPFYVEAIKRAYNNPDDREALEAVYRFGEHDAVRNYVISPKVRANKKRQEAARLIDDATKLEAEANELDPPLVRGG